LNFSAQDTPRFDKSFLGFVLSCNLLYFSESFEHLLFSLDNSSFGADFCFCLFCQSFLIYISENIALLFLILNLVLAIHNFKGISVRNV
jgi:hypothetical protein